MSQHIWKENSIDTGEFEGVMTHLQGYRCFNCKLIIFLPPGVHPNDYDTTVCKINDNVVRSNPLRR